jgi:C-terminal processing protease CtpA/Prc
MTATLLDGHYSLSRDSIFYSPRYDKLLAQGYSELYFLNDSLALTNYLESVETLPAQIGYYGKVKNENLQYFRLAGFGYGACFALDNQKAQKSKDFILNAPAWSKGLIIDLRSNGGGDATDLIAFVKMFTPTEVNWGKRRYRIGQGRFDYGPWEPFVISATPGAYSKPIVVLVDRFSVSMAEITTMALATLPNVTIIGEQTWGGQGPYISEPSEMFLGGPFTLPNGWAVQMADFATKYNDDKCYEGIGFPPDINIKFDLNAYQATQTDNQLEAAINKLK